MAFGNGLDDKDEVMSEINMTPLVDVMLVLLIIFMITVPVLTHSVKLDLPQVSSEPNVVKKEAVRITVSENGSVQWNDKLVDVRTFEKMLQAAARENPQPEMHIYGERKAEYEKVLKVMKKIQNAGIRRLGFITQPHG